MYEVVQSICVGYVVSRGRRWLLVCPSSWVSQSKYDSMTTTDSVVNEKPPFPPLTSIFEETWTIQQNKPLTRATTTVRVSTDSLFLCKEGRKNLRIREKQSTSDKFISLYYRPRPIPPSKISKRERESKTVLLDSRQTFCKSGTFVLESKQFRTLRTPIQPSIG